MNPNKYIQSLQPYTLSKHAAWSHIGDPALLKLDWNESTFQPSPRVIGALQNLITNGALNYYPNTNNNLLRQQLAMYCAVDEANLEFYSSSDGAHEYIFRAFGNPGDTILIVGPTYDNLRVVAQASGLHAEFLNLSSDSSFSPDYKRLYKKIKEIKPSFVYLCNPNNPTSTLWSVDFLEELIREFTDTLFLIDEAYFEFDGVSVSKIASDIKNLIVSRTFSKAFGLAGIRFGYLISSLDNISIIGRIRNGKSVNSFAQVAVMAALEDVDYMLKNVAEVREAKREFVKEFEKLCIPTFSGASSNFVLCDFAERASDVVEYLERQKIFVRALPKLESGGFVRITIGSSNDMKRVIAVIKDVM